MAHDHKSKRNQRNAGAGRGRHTRKGGYRTGGFYGLTRYLVHEREAGEPGEPDDGGLGKGSVLLAMSAATLAALAIVGGIILLALGAS